MPWYITLVKQFNSLMLPLKSIYKFVFYQFRPLYPTLQCQWCLTDSWLTHGNSQKHLNLNKVHDIEGIWAYDHRTTDMTPVNLCHQKHYIYIYIYIYIYTPIKLQTLILLHRIQTRSSIDSTSKFAFPLCLKYYHTLFYERKFLTS